jgi:excisionase family DNA binding protein
MDTAIQQRPMLTLRETAGRLNVSEKTIRRLVGNGELAAVRVGNQLRIDANQLEAWIALASSNGTPG